jgi:hypothetical protein
MRDEMWTKKDGQGGIDLEGRVSNIYSTNGKKA